MKYFLAIFLLFSLTKGKAQSYCKDTTIHYQFVARKVHYPLAAAEAGIQGQVIVQFDVDSTCALINRKVIKGIGHGCDEEALNSMDEAEKKLKADNKSKCCRFKKIEIPVKFKLQ
jgi:TonB family protein